MNMATLHPFVLLTHWRVHAARNPNLLKYP